MCCTKSGLMWSRAHRQSDITGLRPKCSPLHSVRREFVSLGELVVLEILGQREEKLPFSIERVSVLAGENGLHTTRGSKNVAVKRRA